MITKIFFEFTYTKKNRVKNKNVQNIKTTCTKLTSGMINYGIFKLLFYTPC